jgi:PKD repeat protein
MYRKFLAIAAAFAVAAVAVGFGVKTTEAAPIANAGGPYFGTVGVPVQFNGGNTVGAVSFSWSFGDGTTGVGIAPTHIYGAAGTYTVVLTATDSFGFSSQSVTSATISFSSSGLLINQCNFGTVFVNGMLFCNGPTIVATTTVVPCFNPFFFNCVVPVVPAPVVPSQIFLRGR